MKYIAAIKTSLFIFTVPFLICAGEKNISKDYIEKKGETSINWSKLEITATGSGAFPFFDENYEVARIKAEETAKTNGCEKLYKGFLQIVFSEKITIESLLSENDRIIIQKHICQSMNETGKKTFSDASSDINFTTDLKVLLPRLLEFIKYGDETSAEKFITNGEKETLIIKIPGKFSYKPALFPRIISKSGRIVYSYETSSDHIKKTGISVSYLKNTVKEKNSLEIKSLSVKNSSDIIISDSDAQKLQSTLSDKTFNEGKVIIVFN